MYARFYNQLAQIYPKLVLNSLNLFNNIAYIHNMDTKKI